LSRKVRGPVDSEALVEVEARTSFYRFLLMINCNKYVMYFNREIFICGW
jgi:hypothetical protein